METRVERVTAPLADRFATAHGGSDTAETVVVHVADGTHEGIGGVSPASYHGETADSVADVLPDLLAVVESVGDPHAQQRIERRLRERAPDAPAARAAVSGAVHDLAASAAGEPLFRRWGLDPEAAPPTSYTIGLADPETTAERAERAVEAGHDLLKLKLGTDADRARVEALRAVAPDARLRVDANEAFDPAEAVEMARWLADRAELFEQPTASVEGLRAVREAGHLPVAADESCLDAGDVPAVADAVDAVVVKLAKCGGLRPARRQIAAAHAHGLDVMVGCMVASAAAIAPACHLAPLCEFVDLDGALLLASDPYRGVPFDGGTIDLGAVAAGTGVAVDAAESGE